MIDANGWRIPWLEVAHIEPDEMRALMREVVNGLYTCHLKAGDPEFLGMLDWAAREAGEEVKISSFGIFTVRDKGLRMGRNPKTGEPAAILPRRVVVFRPSGKLKERINEILGDAGEDA